MDQLLTNLRRDYPELTFTEGAASCWSPETNHITYVADATPESSWGLLHEMGHALLGHSVYHTDVELLTKEVLAWHQAIAIAQKYKIAIETTYIEDCLDTYRDWLSKRSTCPTCKTKTPPGVNNQYTCFNCRTSWTVSAARHHRSYRRRLQTITK